MCPTSPTGHCRTPINARVLGTVAGTMDALQSYCRTVTVQQVPIPAMGLGTYRLTGRDCRRAVASALAQGYRHVDTAQAYDNEADVGVGLRDSGVDRAEVWITTKLWHDDLDPVRLPHAVEDSLRKLRTDHVDLLLVHWPVAKDLPATLHAMRTLVGDGKVRHLGVSNFTDAQLREALRHGPLLTNQVELHPYLAQPRLLKAAQEADLAITAYAPLARGKVLRDPVIRDIAAAREATPAQVALRWLLDHERVVVLPKSTSDEHLESNLAACWLELDDEDRRRLDALDRGLRVVDPPWAPDWD